LEHFRQTGTAEVSLILCNKPDAYVLERAKQLGISSLLIDKERFRSGDAHLSELKSAGIELIVLAGFLWKIPQALIDAYPQRIINIHPALLPKYGGKGMYGHYVHQAVIEAGERESGITIHLVDEEYDHGRHLAQFTCPVLPDDTPDTLAARIHVLEHSHFPEVVEAYVQKLA
jgi:phosphoribosylglycinamide formyltransferase-1